MFYCLLEKGSYVAAPVYIYNYIDFKFISNWIDYDRGDDFPFNFEPNGNIFGSVDKTFRR